MRSPALRHNLRAWPAHSSSRTLSPRRRPTIRAAALPANRSCQDRSPSPRDTRHRSRTAPLAHSHKLQPVQRPLLAVSIPPSCQPHSLLQQPPYLPKELRRGKRLGQNPHQAGPEQSLVIERVVPDTRKMYSTCISGWRGWRRSASLWPRQTGHHHVGNHQLDGIRKYADDLPPPPRSSRSAGQ